MERESEHERHERARAAIERSIGETAEASLDDTSPAPGEDAAVEDV